MYRFNKSRLIAFPKDDTSPSASSSSESSSESELGSDERCPICLKRFKDQDVGTPESCDHTFCLECLEEWSKHVTTCPVDRSPYKLILAKHAPGLAIFKRIEVVEKNGDTAFNVSDGYSEIFCEVCGRSDNEHHLLLCDSCDAGYHCECLDPPLPEVPEDEWYCPQCLHESDHESALNETHVESVSATSRNRSSEAVSMSRSRVIVPRTGMVERVRQAVYRRRNMSPVSDDSNEEEQLSDSENPSNDAVEWVVSAVHEDAKTRGKTTVRKTSSLQKRKKRTGGKRKKSKKKKSLSRRTRKRKIVKKTRKRWNNNSVPAPSTNSSIAKATAVSSHRVSSLTSLSIYGNANDIDFCPEDSDVPGTSKVSKISSSRTTTCKPTPDLLNRILESQRLLYSRPTTASLRRDGSMELMKCDPTPVKKTTEHERKCSEETKEYDPFDMAQYSESDADESQDMDTSSKSVFSALISFDVSEIPLPCGPPPPDTVESKSSPVKLTFNKSAALKNLMTSYQSVHYEMSSSESEDHCEGSPEQKEEARKSSDEEDESMHLDNNLPELTETHSTELTQNNECPSGHLYTASVSTSDFTLKENDGMIEEDELRKRTDSDSSDSSSYQFVEAASQNCNESPCAINNEHYESEYEDNAEGTVCAHGSDDSQIHETNETSSKSSNFSEKSNDVSENDYDNKATHSTKSFVKNKHKRKSESRTRQRNRELKSKKSRKKRERRSSESDSASTSRTRKHRRSRSARSHKSLSRSSRSSSDRSIHSGRPRSRTHQRKHGDVDSDEETRYSKRSRHISYETADTRATKNRGNSPRKRSKDKYITRHHRNEFDEIRRSAHSPRRHWNQHDDQRHRRYLPPTQENVIPNVSSANVALRYYVPQPQYYGAPPTRIVSPRWYQQNSVMHDHYDSNVKRSHSRSKQAEQNFRSKKEERHAEKKSSSHEKRKHRKKRSASVNRDSNYTCSSSSSSSGDSRKAKKRKRAAELVGESRAKGTPQEELSLEDKQRIFRRLTSVVSATSQNRNTPSGDGPSHSKRSNLIEIVPVETVIKRNDEVLSDLHIDDNRKTTKENITADFSEYLVEEMLQEEEKGERNIDNISGKALNEPKIFEEKDDVVIDKTFDNAQQRANQSDSVKQRAPPILFRLSTRHTSTSYMSLLDINMDCRVILTQIVELIELIFEICKHSSDTYHNEMYPIHTETKTSCSVKFTGINHDHGRHNGHVKNETKYDWNIENLKMGNKTGVPEMKLFEEFEDRNMSYNNVKNLEMRENVECENKRDCDELLTDYWPDVEINERTKCTDSTDVLSKEKTVDSKFNTRMINAWLSSTTSDPSSPIPGIHERSLDKRISLLLDEPVKHRPEGQKVGSWLQSSAKPKQPSDIDNFIEQIFKPRQVERNVLNKSVDEILREASEPYDPESEDPLLELAPAAATSQVTDSPVQTLVKLTETLSKFINSSKIPAEVMAKEREKMPPPPPPPPPMCTAVPEETAEDLERLIRNKEIPSSAKQMERMERYVQKVKRLEEIVACAKECIKPRYIRKDINKVQYKVVMKKTVDKMMRTKGPVDKQKINELINYYIDKRQFK